MARTSARVRISAGVFPTDRSTPIGRTGVVADRAPRVPPDEARARPCVTRSRIVCYKPTVSTLLLAGTTFSLTRIHANRRMHGSREELARVFEKSIGIGRGIYTRDHRVRKWVEKRDGYSCSNSEISNSLRLA